MKAELFINFYVDKNPNRQKELEICLENNFDAGFNRITLIVEEKDEEYLKTLIRNSIRKQDVIVATSNCRPSFQDYFDLMINDADTINCWANSDIFIEKEELNKLKSLPWEKNLAVCLSRYDLTIEGAFQLDRNDSADFWAVKGPCKIKEFPCKCGPGIDNRVAWELNNVGYYIVNPSRDLQVMHLHQSIGNNYRDMETGAVKAETICSPPYFFHEPIFIKDI